MVFTMAQIPLSAWRGAGRRTAMKKENAQPAAAREDLAVGRNGVLELLKSGAGKFVAVWDEDEARGRKYAEEFGAEFEPDLSQQKR